MKNINSVALLKGFSRIASGEQNDCAVYAVATAFDMDYDTAHKEVAERMNRKDGQGTKRSSIIDALTEGTTINGKTVTRVIKSPTKTYKVYGNTIPRQLRLSSFAKENSEGTYVIITRGHALTLKDGVLMDNRKAPKTRALVEVAIKVD